MNDLTKKQREVLEYITRFKEVNGYSPSVREIANGTYQSNTPIHTIMEELKDKGYIDYKPRQPRTIRVIKFIA